MPTPIDVACPLCGGAADRPAFPYRIIWQNQEFGYVRCRRCRTVVVSPAPTNDQLAEMFAWHAYHAGNELQYQAGRYQRLLDLLQRYWPDARTLVDFGCGHGHFIRDARLAGWKAHGIEFDVVTRQRTAEFSGCPVTDLERAPIADVATTLNSLCAVPNPSQVIQRLDARRVLLDMAVEENPRLALVARLFARPSRSPVDGTPTVLWRATAAGIDRWFADLGYRPVYREITDAGWPYAQSTSLPRRAIGRLSVATSRLIPSFGDRLTALYERH